VPARLLLIVLLAGCSGTSVLLFEERLVDGRRRPGPASPPVRVLVAGDPDPLLRLLEPHFVAAAGDSAGVWLERRRDASPQPALPARLLLLAVPDGGERAQRLLEGQADLALLPARGLERFADQRSWRLRPTMLADEAGTPLWIVAAASLGVQPWGTGMSEAEVLLSALGGGGP
jgi:hypothetical protein